VSDSLTQDKGGPMADVAKARGHHFDVWEFAEAVAMGVHQYHRTDDEVQELAVVAMRLRRALGHHLDPDSDPCQDRGVDWPCDVADAFGYFDDSAAGRSTPEVS
jgi:hypothetical protein